MSAAAYNRGSRVIARGLGRSCWRSERCGGTFRNGPGKRFVRCDRCRSVDWEKNEGDRCLQIIDVQRTEVRP